MSDKDIGGFSKANIEYVPPNTTTTPSPTKNKNGHMRFTGNISIELPPNKPDVHRSGYAAWRTRDRRATIFGKSFWDVDPYAFLAIRFKSDGRSYFVNLQTDSIVPTDIHQHRLYARRPGEWETVLIKWGDFVRTNHGMVVEPQSEMLRQRVKSVGIGLIDRIPGPFDLSVERIWASNEMGEDLVKEDKRQEQGLLRGKLGQTVKWGEVKETKR
jgi:NADH dehydrogenase [ubiquinone] 1 alpha subcomplex assembly factor 1